MASMLQQAIASGVSTLKATAGMGFTFSAVRFVAWPVDSLEYLSTPVEATAESVLHFESDSAPAFKSADTLTDDAGKKYSVYQRRPKNPTTGVFRFSVTPGRGA